MNFDASWTDPNSSWQAKANRAQEHIASLRQHVKEFRASGPYSVTPEPTGKPERMAYRLRILTPVPVVISATVGDILHNQRAALENLAFELAKRSQGGLLTPSQERDVSFPICEDPDKFQRFVDSKGRHLYDSKALTALRLVQPFIYLEESHNLGIAEDETFEDTFRDSILNRLNQMWNIDKHRRLTVMAWWLDMLYWGSNGESNRRAYPGDGTMEDGSILFHIEGTDEGMGDVSTEFDFVLTDDPASSPGEPTGDVLTLVGNFQQHLWYIFSRVFSEMSRE